MSTVTIVSGVAENLEAGDLAFSIGGIHLSFEVNADVESAIYEIVNAARSNVVVDGFPTTVEAAMRLDAALARSNLRVTRFMFSSSLDDHAFVENRALRRTCSSPLCGARYNLRTMRPRRPDVCDACGTIGLLRSHHDSDACVLAEAAEKRRKSMLIREHYLAVADDFVEKDPVDSLSEFLLEIQSYLVEAKKGVAVAIADEKRLAKLATDARQAVMDSEQALHPVKTIAEKEEIAVRYEKHLTRQRGGIGVMRNALCELNNKIEEVRRERDLLVAIKTRAEAEQKLLRLAWSAAGVIDPNKQ